MRFMKLFEISYQERGENMELCRCSYSILAILNKLDMTSKARGLTLDEIMECEKLSKRTTIHKKVKELQKYGYVGEGAKAARAKTYYITESGISLLPTKRKVEDLKDE